jgi:hypothetical protein
MDTKDGIPDEVSCCFYQLTTQPLTDMSTRNLPGRVKSGLGIRLTNSPPSVSRSSRRCGSLDVSEQYGSSRPVIGKSFTFARSGWLQGS